MDRFKITVAISSFLFYTHKRHRKQDIYSRVIKPNNQFNWLKVFRISLLSINLLFHRDRFLNMFIPLYFLCFNFWNVEWLS